MDIEREIDSLLNSLKHITSEKKIFELFEPFIDEVDIYLKGDALETNPYISEKISVIIKIFDHLEILASGINYAPNVNSVKEYFHAKKELAEIAKDFQNYPVHQRIQKESRELDEKFRNFDCSIRGLHISELETNPPDCLCGKAMVLRRNRTNGEYFFGCSNFPSCRFTRQIEF